MAYTTIKKPSDYFNTVTYTGNGSTQSITGVGFQPDLTWIKNRSADQNHSLTDIVRGATKTLRSDVTSAETTDAQGQTSFDSDGFTVGSEAKINGSGNSIVAWNWKAGTTSGITQGSATITPSSYSFNATSGFSIIKFTTPSSGTGTIPHGLGVTPKVIIGRITGTSSWQCGFTAMNSAWTSILTLDNTAAEVTSNAAFGNTPPDSTLFTMNSANWGANSEAIAYCFAEKKGFSKFGSYTGNGNADGAFIYTGFKPAFIMIKKTSGVASWYINDNKRSSSGGFNVSDEYLRPDLSNGTGTDQNGGDFLSNGFKLRNSDTDYNISGATYIYMAFAEEPLVGDNPATAR